MESMRRALILLVGLGLLLVFNVSGQLFTPSSRLVGDVSWPNCTLNLPREDNSIVGLNYGRVFTVNPCLTKEVLNSRFISLYLNTAYPGLARGRQYQSSPKDCSLSDNICLAYNYGYSAGTYDANLAVKQNVYARHWWLDVETVNSWDANAQANRAALEGMVASLSHLVGRANLGFYSAPSQWATLTGSWHNNASVWLATGSSQQKQAVVACGVKPSFTHGPIILTQFTPSLDQNYQCKAAIDF